MKYSTCSTPLIGLEVGDEPSQFFIDGDPERIPVESHPVGPPRVIEGMPFMTMYDRQVEMLAREAPPMANAFILGPPIPSVMDTSGKTYATVVQFLQISEGDHARGLAVTKPKWAIRGFTDVGGRLSWIVARPT